MPGIYISSNCVTAASSGATKSSRNFGLLVSAPPSISFHCICNHTTRSITITRAAILPNSYAHYKSVITLPFYVDLKEDEIKYVAECFKKLLVRNREL